MQTYTFYVIDDDLACRRILGQIIEDEGLGEVIGELADGHGDVIGLRTATSRTWF